MLRIIVTENYIFLCLWRPGRFCGAGFPAPRVRGVHATPGRVRGPAAQRGSH